MASIKIENFGGEMPSTSARALPANASQENRNLYLATTEFRPLAQDVAVSTTSNGTRTLYRFSRDASGNFNSDTTTGWITSTQERSYVKGQVNDERTERTYFTFDDGSARPRAIDVTGQDRLLGVPRPTKPVVSANITDELTPEEAEGFLFGDAAEAVRLALRDNFYVTEPGSRYSGDTIFGGPYTKNGMLFATQISQVEYWCLFAEITNARAEELQLDLARLSVYQSEVSTYVPVVSLPYTYLCNRTALTTALNSIVFPDGSGDKTGTRVFDDAQVNKIIDTAIEYLDPSTFAKSSRDRLDALTKEFYELLQTTRVTVDSPPPKPVEPAKPTVAEYTYDEGGAVRSWQWDQYDQDMAAYRAAMDAYNEALSKASKTTGSINNRLKEIQDEATSITQSIEADLNSRFKQLTDTVTKISDFISSEGGVEGFVGETSARVVETRFYIVTFVTDWGEESEPSPVSDMVEIDQNDSVTINLPQTASGESFASRHIEKWRIYRSATGSTSSAFQFVEELSTTSASFTDDKRGQELGEVCPTITWAEPPYRADQQFDGFPKPVVGTNPYLRGLVGMPNGIMAGFFDNTVAFCEPYVPYAWPVEYQITTEFPIVGLGVFGQTLFVGTTGNPYFISGADSASMSAQKLDAKQSCVSRRSIASVQGGVLYASPDGLCVADPNGVKVVTSGLYTREDWQKLDPATMIAAAHENIYYLFYSGNGGGCLTFDLSTGKLGRIGLSATAVFTDTLTDTLYAAYGTSIQAVFGATTRRVGRWRSAKMVLPAQSAVAWLKVYGDQSESAPVTVRWYGDGQLRHTAVLTSTEPVRLPPGRWLEHEVEVESTARVTRVVLAGDTKDLQSV